MVAHRDADVFHFGEHFKAVFAAFDDMLVGRLEIFPMLVLFAPSTWLRSKGHLDRRLRARNLF